MNGEDACLWLRVLIFIKFHYIHFSQLEWGERGGAMGDPVDVERR